MIIMGIDPYLFRPSSSLSIFLACLPHYLNTGDDLLSAEQGTRQSILGSSAAIVLLGHSGRSVAKGLSAFPRGSHSFTRPQWQECNEGSQGLPTVTKAALVIVCRSATLIPWLRARGHFHRSLASFLLAIVSNVAHSQREQNSAHGAIFPPAFL